MGHLQKPLGVLFVSALFLAGCAGAPETSSDAPRATPPPPPSQALSAADQNLAEVRPPRWAELLLYTHPPIYRRIAREEAVTIG